MRTCCQQDLISVSLNDISVLLSVLLLPKRLRLPWEILTRWHVEQNNHVFLVPQLIQLTLKPAHLICCQCLIKFGVLHREMKSVEAEYFNAFYADMVISAFMKRVFDLVEFQVVLVSRMLGEPEVKEFIVEFFLLLFICRISIMILPIIIPKHRQYNSIGKLQRDKILKKLRHRFLQHIKMSFFIFRIEFSFNWNTVSDEVSGHKNDVRAVLSYLADELGDEDIVGVAPVPTHVGSGSGLRATFVEGVWTSAAGLLADVFVVEFVEMDVVYDCDFDIRPILQISHFSITDQIFNRQCRFQFISNPIFWK